MSDIVFLAVLFAAFLHAGWNAIIKTGLSKQTSMFLLSIGHGAFGVMIAMISPFPPASVWPWIIGSGLIHTFYQLFLSYAYDQGDLSRVYPIARGAAPLIVLLFSSAFLDDPMADYELLGVLVLAGGIGLMAHGALRQGESRRLIPLAIGSALATAGYTLIDGLGARHWGLPLAYVGWLMICSAVFYAPVAVMLKGRGVLLASPRAWGQGMFAAAASFAAYAIAVWAMTRAPIALVGALRETSILFAVLIGWWAFGERMDRGKVLAVLLILCGVVLTRM